MRRAVIIGLTALVLVLAGCGDDEPSGYNAETEENFIETCEESGEPEVCQCAYDGFVEEIPFDRFQRVDDRLAEDPDADLPDDFITIYTDCVIAQGGGSAGTTPTIPPTTTTTAAGGSSTTVVGEPGVTDTTVAP